VKKLLIIFFAFALLSFTRDDKSTTIVKHAYDFFAVDNMGNVYTVANDEIRKFNKKGELLKIFSNKRAGKIFSIDASNALRIVVFYKDQSQVIFLDSQLTQNGDPIDLLNLNLEQSDLICSSFNNGIWLYNRQNAELIRLDEKLERVVSTGNLNNLLNTELKPLYLNENSGYVYMSDTKNGILVFDIYGTYYKTISLFNIRSFQVAEQQIFYYKDSVISSYNTKLLNNFDSLIAKPYPKDMKWMNGTFYKQYTDSLMWE
jgi:hypothetical protein